MKLALISLDQKWEDKEYNLQRCDELAEDAVAFGAEIVIFPEMTLTGFSFNTARIVEDADDSPTCEAFSSISQRLGVTVVAGVVLQRHGHPVNTLIAFSETGDKQAIYIKMHPFSFSGEDQFFRSGDGLAIMSWGDFTFGFSICYDLRFPELFSALSKECDMLVNIANWPQKRVNHWITLLKARAIECQAFMVGVNRTGTDGNGLAYERSSYVINPNGDVVVPEMSKGEIDIVNIHRKWLDDFRGGFATLKDRRPDIYRKII